MIIDQETDRVFFSDLLRSDARFQAAYHELTAILAQHGVAHGLLQGTRDIWCRDYMPIQKSTAAFVQFRYEPSYLQAYPDLQTNPATVLARHQIPATFSRINLDGGNVLRWQDRVIVTDRIFAENPAYPNPSVLIKELEQLLEAEVLVIPQIRSDMTGHADGLVRFYDRNTLIGNRLQDEYAYWRTGMQQVLADHNLSYIDLPFLDHKVKGYSESAIGCYVNYLEVGELVVVPVFEVSGNKDAEVLDILSGVFSDRRLATININEVGKHGGLLNCISWTVKMSASAPKNC